MLRQNKKTTKSIVFGCFVNGLSLIRSLGRHGIPMVAVDYSRHPIGFFSKYVVEKAIAPDPRESPRRFLAFLLNKSDKWRGGLLIPTNDEILEVISHHKKVLSKSYMVAAPDWNALKNILNKRILYKNALNAAVPVPSTFYPKSMESLLRHKDEYVYPCVLKPCLTYLFRDRFKRKVFVIRNFSELKSKFEYTQKIGLEMMIQEIIPGKDDTLYTYAAYYDSNSKPLAEYTSRKLRQIPPGFGGPRIMEVTDTPEIVEYSRRLLSRLSYTSLCNIEYKKDSRDSDFKLLDLNARSGISISLSITNGVDFPWIMYNDMVLHRKVQTRRRDKHRMWAHLYGDLIASFRYHNKENWRINDYLRPYFTRTYFAVFAWDDMLPFFMQWSKPLIRKLTTETS